MKKNVLILFLLLNSLGCLKIGPDKETIPAAPSNVQGLKTGSTNVTVTWTDNSSNEIEFEVEVKKGSEPFELWAWVGKDINVYYNDNLAIGESYTFRIRASNGAGYSAYSNEVTVIF